MERLNHKLNQNVCIHRDRDIITLKSYRRNFTHGRNSKSKSFGRPRKITKLCEKCGKKMESWKP